VIAQHQMNIVNVNYIMVRSYIRWNDVRFVLSQHA